MHETRASYTTQNSNQGQKKMLALRRIAGCISSTKKNLGFLSLSHLPGRVSPTHDSKTATSLPELHSPGSVSRFTQNLGVPERRFYGTADDLAVPYGETTMFCRQCEQTQDGIGCTVQGVCGKDPDTSEMQDAAIEVVKCVSLWCVASRNEGASVPSKLLHHANVWTLKTVFATMTNVNFSEEMIFRYIQEGLDIKHRLSEAVKKHPPVEDTAHPKINHHTTMHDMEKFSRDAGVLERQERMGDPDSFSLNEIALYGLKGACAYAYHAYELGRMEENIMTSIHEVWAKLSSDEPDTAGLLATALRVGEINAEILALLDEAHAESLGTPVPTPVRETAVKGKAILVSGHDLRDLQAILEQTDGTGVNIYTHGEMMPGHAYPELNKYSHLVGNFGTAWQAQKFEFNAFPGPIVMTTNCLMPPRRGYMDRIYTTNVVGFDKVKHIANRDFSEVIAKARKMDGFARTVEPARYLTVGFNHRSIVPEHIISAMKAGDLSHIFLIGGCDGAEWSRNYYTDLADLTPDDSLILTMGCAKNRFVRNEELKDTTLANGLPRVLDMGQCNDAYSAIVVAKELSKALNCDINDLPLSLVLSHLEQKAAAVLLTLLHLGFKNIRLGPKLPAFISPNVLEILQKEYNLMPVSKNPQDDLVHMLSSTN